MTMTRRFLPSPRRVVVVLPPRAQLVGTLGFYEALDAANRIVAARGDGPLYALELVGIDETTSSIGGPVLVTPHVRSVRSAHTVVIGGTLEMADGGVEPTLVREVGRLARRAERVVSLCVGAFVLGALGLLDGRRCTTHWLALDRLRARFPRALVERDAIFTEDGALFTSAGATAGIDMALHLIRLDHGGALALRVARALVVFAQRPGGQSQFGSALQPRNEVDERMGRLLRGVLHDPGGDHRVEALAAAAGMSPRNFARVFRAQTGETPAAFVARGRVEAAQRALVQSDRSLEEIARTCGFGTSETLRRTFLRVTSVTPSAYRERFRA